MKITMNEIITIIVWILVAINLYLIILVIAENCVK